MPQFSFVSSMIFQTRTKLIQDPYVSIFAVVIHLYLIFFFLTFIEKLLLKLIKSLSQCHLVIIYCSVTAMWELLSPAWTLISFISQLPKEAMGHLDFLMQFKGWNNLSPWINSRNSAGHSLAVHNNNILEKLTPNLISFLGGKKYEKGRAVSLLVYNVYFLIL